MVELTKNPIDSGQVLASVQSHAAGAVVLFLGTTRGITDGRSTESLDYECFADMAIKKLKQLENTARERWQVEQLTIVHRLGHIEVGESSVAIAVSSPHRSEAFEAGRWLIDTVKQEVPIWKKENWGDGTSEWVHPGTDMPGTDMPAASNSKQALESHERSRSLMSEQDEVK